MTNPRGQYIARALRKLSLPDDAICAALVAELGLTHADALAALEAAHEEAPRGLAVVDLTHISSGT
jgi:hypothetical protein